MASVHEPWEGVGVWVWVGVCVCMCVRAKKVDT
jgi:hypothetical protein